MGLMLVTSERMDELENEANSYRIGLGKMEKEHDKLLNQYRQLRDGKDDEIERLHNQIEVLKSELMEKGREIGRLKQMIRYYEGERKKC